MKKSAQVGLTVVAVVGLASCGGRHPDPCEAATFNEQACREAVKGGGYYFNGSWFPVQYHYPYPYYYDSYRGYVSSGGVVQSDPAVSYSSAGVERGGFGTTGAGHASDAGVGE